MNKESKIYVAGHQGMVGSAIVRVLLKEGYKNLILRSRKELNLFNQSAVNAFFQKEKPDYVIVAAARVGGIAANMENPAEFLYENLEIQNNVIWHAHMHGVKKLLFLGSSCIYPRESAQPMKEEYLMDGKPEPTNEGYSIAKIAGIKLCEKIYSQYNQHFLSCMPTNIYGERDNFDPDSSHVIPALMRRMHSAKITGKNSVVVWGSGNTRREFLYVDDLANAIVFLMRHYNNAQFVNIGTGEDVSIKGLAFAIKRIVGFEGELIFDTTKPDGMPKKLLDVNKIHTLGWHHKVSIDEGLRKTYKWFIENYGGTKK